MAYILYINGHEIEVDSKAISQTRQVNDLAKLDNRQSSVTNKFTAAFTPKNVKAMEYVYMAGNQSNVPYQKNVSSLYDADSGVCLIYKGWANVMQSSRKGYDIFIYDGLIDFYRRIENKTLTDVDISGLNHAKSITNIVASWNNTLPYFYAIADYNGKNKFITTGGVNIEINTDYQVPSARVSYIWDRIFTFAGFTYSGSFFNTQNFKNLFMSFPKPVPTLVPHRVLIHTGICYPRHSTVLYYDGNALLNRESYLLTLPRENFLTPQASVTNNLSQTGLGQNGNGSMGYVYNHNRINILQNGTYTIDAFAPNINFNYYHRNSADVLISSGVVTDVNSLGTFKTHLFNCLAGDTIAFLINEQETVLAGLTFNWELNLVDGFEANFEEALVDFNATDFIKEIIQRAGLTAFKDKYRDHIEYLTMSEILQSNNIEDWSDKFQYKDIEKYRIGQYAKRNNFKYRYNTENEAHNDGYITINDENLQDDYDVLVSKIYSPEKSIVVMAGRQVNVFKIWDKELRDDSTVEYKDLSGRYYFMRFEMINVSTTLASESLNQQQAVTSVAMSSYSRLNFNEILIDNYASIESILDKAKAIDAYFYLKPIDIERYNFKGLIYVEQLASYYLVNKILNFTKGKVTKCELIEVDYKKAITIIGPPLNTATYITINSFVVVGCVVTLTYLTDATLNTPINLDCILNNFGLPIFTPPDLLYGHSEVVHNTAVTNTVSFTLEAGAFYQMAMTIQGVGTANIPSNIVYFENTAGCVIVSPTSLIITAVTLLSSDALSQTFKIDFTTNAVLPRNIHVQNYKTPIPIDPNNPYAGSFGGWSGYTDNGTATTNSINHSISRIFGDPLQIQIKIGSKESNIFTI
jgi:hypothetical protein